MSVTTNAIFTTDHLPCAYAVTFPTVQNEIQQEFPETNYQRQRRTAPSTITKTIFPPRFQQQSHLAPVNFSRQKLIE